MEVISKRNPTIKCPHCKSKLAYSKEDVKSKIISRGPCDYGGDMAGIEESYEDYIICPICGEEIVIQYWKDYR